MRAVRVGGPIFLVVLGAVLYFAISDRISGVNLGMIGLITMIAGAVWLVIEMIMGRPRSVVTSERTSVQGTGGGVAPAAGDNQVVEREVRQDGV